MFKYLPDAEIAWKDVWLGAFVTAVLFSIGKTLIGLYLGSSAVATTFGAAGSLVLLLLWAYYSGQILLFGAEFTQVYANVLGSKVVPEEGAVSTSPQPAPPTGTPAASPGHTGSGPGKVGTPAATPGIASPGVNTNPSRQIIPITWGPVYEVNPRIEQENQQTARFIAGLMTVSFLTGIFTTFFGLKQTKTRK
jgi:membrane protein